MGNTKTTARKKLAKTFAAYALTGAALLGGGFALQSGVNALQHEPAAVTQSVTEALAQTPAQARLAEAPQGDGHPVLVIPGFFGNDLHTALLQSRLRDHGYAVYGWDGGMNMGPSEDKARHLEKHLAAIFAANGNRKVSLVGYSLGGVYARELARRHPEYVRDVITLGAPFGQRTAMGAVEERVAEIQKFYGTAATDPRDAPPVPTVSLFSTRDWIAGWREALNKPAPNAHNIRVAEGHAAMPFSADVAALVLRQLAQNGDHWQPLETGPGRPRGFAETPKPQPAKPGA
ncbi:MAG TPA: alpha/beta fold hydrolase [Patescibacteria group bacterium]|nr:alpha/beta fold hydrolase [Patescibacteria group bacterium]